jgi:hypothetical protein
MNTCPNLAIFQSLESSLDRQEEAAWFIRSMEKNYHRADQFRWCLNSFLRALKEVPQLISMEVQGNAAVVQWLRGQQAALRADPLLDFLFKQRDVIVHKSMLKPASRGIVGFTRGRGMKLGMGMPIDPLADSTDAILRYIHVAAQDKDFLGILYSEEDGSGEYTCVQREWRLQAFPDVEITRLCATAWERVAGLTLATAEKLGADVITPEFELRDPNSIQFEIYRPEWIKEQLELAKSAVREATSAVN